MKWFTCPTPNDYNGLVPVQCPICQEHVANVRLNDVFLPLKGSMFLSPDPAHGFEPPFPPDVGWEFCLCPWGGYSHRGVIDEKTILLQGYGPYEVKPKPEEVIENGTEERIEKGRQEGQQGNQGREGVLMIPHKRAKRRAR